MASLTIGTNDGNITTTSPVFQGVTNGIKSTINFKFYDGIAKGQTKAIDNESKVTDKEENSTISHGEETIDEAVYKTAYLEHSN